MRVCAMFNFLEGHPRPSDRPLYAHAIPPSAAAANADMRLIPGRDRKWRWRWTGKGFSAAVAGSFESASFFVPPRRHFFERPFLPRSALTVAVTHSACTAGSHE